MGTAPLCRLEVNVGFFCAPAVKVYLMLQIHDCHTWETGHNDLLFETAVKNCVLRKQNKTRKDCSDTLSCVNTGETMSWQR